MRTAAVVRFYLVCGSLLMEPLISPCFAAKPLDFDSTVAPILSRRCLECHSGADPEGGLDLSMRATTIKGGESGPAIVPGNVDQSPVWLRIRDDEMPPKHPLPQSEKDVLKEWLSSGAEWGTDPIDPFRISTDQRAGYDWWSLQPITNQPPPDIKQSAHRDWVKNGVDHFIAHRLEAAGLEASPETTSRLLIRRLSFDLLGLPPNPEDVDEFVNDDRPDAYERLVDRFLDSPNYGVRWARHWLDVARFGESQGFERDKIRENSWPYRDWVIDAFNSDMPYDEFARLQIAGDVLHPDEPASVIATGFLVAGAYDEVGNSQQSAAMRAVVRQDELEDFVSLVGQTFLGLTVNCARCHDHKFDPVSQKEYYRLAAALAGVRHGSRDVISREDRKQAAEVDEKLRTLRHAMSRIDLAGRERAQAAIAGGSPRKLPVAVVAPIARWDFESDLKDSLGNLHGRASGNARVENGRLLLDGKNSYVATEPLKDDLQEKTLEAWVQLPDLKQRGGGVISVQSIGGGLFDAIVFGEREPRRWMAGSNGFTRTKSFSGAQESEAAAKSVHIAIVYHSDGTIVGYRNGQRYGTGYQAGGLARFAREKSHVLFGLRHAPPGGNRMLTGSIELAQLYDQALTDEEVAASAAVAGEGVSQEEILAALTDAERSLRDDLSRKIDHLTSVRKTLHPISVYAVTPRTPQVSHVLLRGNPAAKGDVVSAGGIASIPGVDAEFGLAPDASDRDRRVRLAEWMTAAENPLFARVLVNRLWHYHFGKGLVETPNDFGFNGGRPSHPELIDWLASEFIRSGYSLKAMHRLILTSATWRQSSAFREEPFASDADNRLLWRKSPVRLEAELLRDTTLSVAGLLNGQMTGPGYRDFDTFVRNTQFYTMKEVAGPEFNRRSIYRMWIRSGRSPFLDVFDCPDPSTKTPKRAVTVTPLQALSLMNNSFVLRMADRISDRVESDAGRDPENQLKRLYQLTYGRLPDEDELAAVTSFVEKYGMPEFCRVALNSNEFLYLD